MSVDSLIIAADADASDDMPLMLMPLLPLYVIADADAIFFHYYGYFSVLIFAAMPDAAFDYVFAYFHAFADDAAAARCSRGAID